MTLQATATVTTESAGRLSSSRSKVCDPPWSQSAEISILKPEEVHLWSASLDVSDEKALYYESCLDQHELARANRYSIELSRSRFVCARGILKELLGMYTGINPTEMSFNLGPLGKPYLSAELDPPLQFNSTDTGSEALFAMCRSGEVGVDIEFNSRQVRHSEIASRKFSDQEHQQYLDLLSSQRKEFFLKIWTRKEAFGKARGVGIRYQLNSVNLVNDSGSDQVSVQDENDTLWEIVQISPASGVTACVVTEGVGWRFECFRLSHDRTSQ